MSPLAAARARLACAPRADREPVRIALLRLGWKTNRAVINALATALVCRETPVDAGAALSGGAWGEGGELVALGGSR